MIDLQTISSVVSGQLLNANVRIDAVSTDSRLIPERSLFVALKGENFNGHDFVGQAAKRGARAAMVDTCVNNELPQIVVQDTELALGEFSKYWRNQFDLPLVAVTGSCGKTTVKELIGSILSNTADTIASQASYNNSIGLPLTLLKIRKNHRYAVVEIGMNQLGEIEHLSKIASPTVAVINNAGPAHLEFLHSVKQVAKEKGELISGVSSSGTVVLNRDDAYFDYWKEYAQPRTVLSFGFSANADVTADYSFNETGALVSFATQIGNFQTTINLLGKHNIANAMAAVTAAIAVGISKQDIIVGLKKMTAVKGRLQMRQHKYGGRLIDDTYNANPSSTAAAINFLSKLKGDKRLIVGDMFELGANSIQFHQDLGRKARNAGINKLYCVGTLTEHAALEFGRGASHYKNKNELVIDLESHIDANTTLLVKGSRGMKMEQITDRLCANHRLERDEAPAC